MECITFTSQNVLLSGILRETTSNKSRAVVFCHEAFEFQESWFDYAEQLTQKGFTTFTFDFTGHGDSQGTPSLVDLRVWAYNIRDALNELGKRGYRRFGLVGWGCGGTAALLAAAHDQRIACLVSLASPVLLMPSLGERIAYSLISLAGNVKMAIWKKPLTLSRLNELENLQLVSTEELNQQLLADPRRQASLRAVPIPDSMHSVWVDITRALENVRIPVLVIHGKADHVVPYNQSEKLFASLSGPKEHFSPETSGHALHLDQDTQQVFQATYKWIKKFLS